MSFRHFPDRHLGTRIALELDKMIEELGLDDLSIDQWSTNDNAANMIKSIRESVYLKQYLCDIHTLQLAINDAFKDVDGMNNVLNKSKALAKFTHKSDTGLQNLKSACKVKGRAFKKLKNPGDTRWNGKYTNMESILYLKDVFQSLFIEDEDLFFWGGGVRGVWINVDLHWF